MKLSPIVDDFKVDLAKATLFADSNRGQCIPQFFAQTVKRECVTGVSDEDYKILEAGPDHELYLDAWINVLDNATISDPINGACYLHHDEDLWVVPVEKEEVKPTETKHVLGYDFRPFEEADWDGFAGADEGSFIHYCDDQKTVLIWSPDGMITEFVMSDDLLGTVATNYVPEEPTKI
jgi:hypothetical protein